MEVAVEARMDPMTVAGLSAEDLVTLVDVLNDRAKKKNRRR